MSDELSRMNAQDTDETVEGIDRLNAADPETAEDDFEGHRFTDRNTDRNTDRFTDRNTD